jgi:protein TonB
MDINKILKSDYLDLVFEGRNKKYGSYDLRRTYNSRMKKSGVVILTLGLLLFGYNLFANMKKKEKPLPPPPPIEVTLTEVPPIDEKAPPPPPPPSEPPPVKPTVAFTPPDIKKDMEVRDEKQIVDQTELKDKAAGLTTQEGDPGGIDPGIIDNPGTGTGLVEGPPAEPTVYKVVEQMPEFPGGEKALYEWIGKNIKYPQKAMEANKSGTVRVSFVVNEDGSISNVEVPKPIGFDMDKEAIRVVSGMPKWAPGKMNGKAVKVLFKIPIQFTLQ